VQLDKIYLTENDSAVIRRVLRKYSQRGCAAFLERELRRAEIVPDERIPENVITLHSRARVLEESSGKEGDIVVVPPSSASPACGYVSVLAPAGAAVIGRSEGQVMEWASSAKMTRRYRVVKVLFQPEAENRICVAS
jgi:regulator of nucleoside diphosphate kinase